MALQGPAVGGTAPFMGPEVGAIVEASAAGSEMSPAARLLTQPSVLEGSEPISLENMWLERVQKAMETPQVCPSFILLHGSPKGPALSQESNDSCKDGISANEPDLPRNLAMACFSGEMRLEGARSAMETPEVCPSAVLPLESPQSSTPSRESNDSCKDAFSANEPNLPQNLPKMPFSAENPQEIISPRKDEGFWGQKWVEKHKKSLREAFLGKKPPNVTKLAEVKIAPSMGNIPIKAPPLWSNLGENSPFSAEKSIMVEPGRQAPNLPVGPHVGQEIPRESQNMSPLSREMGQNPPNAQNTLNLEYEMGQNPQESTSTSSLGPPVVEFAQREISQATRGDTPPVFSAQNV